MVFVFCVTAVITSPAQNLTTLVAFDGTNGGAPSASLIQASDGNLYGTTEYGGPVNGCEGGTTGCGTVFKITTGGTLSTLHTFVYSDGAWPVSPVVQGSDGNFYGTNQGEGDSGGAGAIFKTTPSGTLTVLLYSGSYVAGLVQGRDGNFYGTTPRGYNYGTVFKITPSGTPTPLYTFSGGSDGANPQAGLVLGTDGNFYGTTYSGGTSNFCGGGCGTVFQITPGGSLTTLHSFSGTDGFNVAAGLVQGSDGNFYGTTVQGGANSAGGVIYKITPSGNFTVLYSFCSQSGCTDGLYPKAGLIQATDGNFYGTTFQGGAHGQGTVFVITPSGSLTTLYSFCPQSGCADGANPVGGLVQANDGNFYGTTSGGGGSNSSGTVFKLQVPKTYTLTVYTGGIGTVTSTDGYINCPGACSHPYVANTPVTLNATPAQGWTFSGWSGACSGTGSCNLTMTQNLSVTATFNEPTNPVQLVPVAPCRLVDTRNPNGEFGGPALQAYSVRSFTIPDNQDCQIPSGATAYSLNVTVVPQKTLGYLTVWPTGQNQPLVSTLNSLDGRVKANAAIVPAGNQGAVSFFVTDTTDLILDIDGYFTTTSALAFYPLSPCRVADTRNPTGGLGGPYLQGGVNRDFPMLQATSCFPTGANPVAYSLNFTAVPHGFLGYLTVCPTPSDPNQGCPLVSTLNSYGGQVTANAAIVPVGVNGAIRTFVSNDSDLVIDINGYFGAPGQGGLSLYPVTPCRVLDTRTASGGNGAFEGDLNPPVDVRGSSCGIPSQSKAYVFNATVVPQGPLGYLTLWPDGQTQPLVSTLNALDGIITSNMAIVPASVTNGKIDVWASPVYPKDPTDLTDSILDISSYFAP